MVEGLFYVWLRICQKTIDKDRKIEAIHGSRWNIPFSVCLKVRVSGGTPSGLSLLVSVRSGPFKQTLLRPNLRSRDIASADGVQGGPFGPKYM